MPDSNRVSYRAAARSGLARRFRQWSVIALIVATALWLATLSPSYEACVSDYAQAHKTEETNPEPLRSIEVKGFVFLRCEGVFLDANGILLTAAFTLAIALFTWTLKRSTDELWKAHRHELEATERAFVSIDGFNYELTTEADLPTAAVRRLIVDYDLGLSVTRFAVAPRWKNTGTTATRNLKINVHIHGPGGDLLDEPAYPNADRPMFLAPQAIETGEFIEMAGLDALIQRGQAGAHGPVPLYLIYGKATYEDVFGYEHFIKWCYRVRPERHSTERMTAGFIQYRDFNSTDEDND